MTDKVYTKAKWISDKDYTITFDGTILATKGDMLEVHGKHASDGEYAVKGTRNTTYFWVKPEDIELSDPI
jgi:hypothetical protein